MYIFNLSIMQTITKLFFIFFLLHFTIGVVLSSTQQIVHDDEAKLSPKVQYALTKKRNIQGSYRLRLPKVPFSINGKKLLLTLCNRHTFRIEVDGPSNQIKLILETSTEKACLNSIDDQYIALISSITSYNLDGSRLDLFKNRESIAFAVRQYTPENENSIKGKWQLQLRNLPLQVSADTLQFTGCNENSFDYKINGRNINITPKQATQVLCNIDNDNIFSKALVRGKTITFGEVKFDLYTRSGELTAYTTPYVN